MRKLLDYFNNSRKKILSLIFDNILFLETVFLLIFIPLFPKIPLLSVKYTWVYVRAEDFIVLFVIISWIILLLRRKITLRTPLTLPILIFWIIGAIATIDGILIVFPMLANVHPNVAFLSLVRHIEYMSLFFVAYFGMKDKKALRFIISALIVALLGVVLYGFGQKYLGFPAYLTMNEEYAKGIPIQLSHLSRVPSTFGGHYDLAAYLVLIIPILASLFFGFKNWLVKTALLAVSFLGFVLLLMTVSRISFFALFASLLIVIFFQKKKLVLVSIPLVGVMVILLLSLQPTLLNRFKSTVSQADVMVDAKTGESLGNVKFVPKEYFQDKLVLQRRVKDRGELNLAISGQNQDVNFSSASAVLPYRFIPPQVPLVTAINASTGESLTQGTGYINLYLSPVIKRAGSFYYELPPDVKSSPSAQVIVLAGDFLIKKASAYDLSFTTRFQGEWPNALEAFRKNVLLGSGYGSVSLAVDNNYLRTLGEVGLLGFASFFAIFLALGIYIKKIYKDIDSPVAKSFVLGFGAGVLGLAVNATLIDVFEASKIAFLLWALSGITLGLLALYQRKQIDLYSEIKKAAISRPAIIVYLLLLCIVLFSPILNSYFVGDDFTWLRWVSDCKNNCHPITTILNFFTNSDGFFYRPGTKVYFYLMHSAFWLNQVMYHLVSVLLHFAVAILFFILAKKILRNHLLAIASALIFLILSGGTEAIFWISSTGHLFTAAFGLFGLLLFILWDEKRKTYYFLGSFISFSLALLFNEGGVVYPALIAAYAFREGGLSQVKNLIKRRDYLSVWIPVFVYFLARYGAHSHWLSGDYSYDIVKLPFNLVGNILGYASLDLVGPVTLPVYEFIRTSLRSHIAIAAILTLLMFLFFLLFYKYVIKRAGSEDKRIIAFGLMLFLIPLIPFLPLGNITSRYSYLSSAGLILILILFLKKIYEYLHTNGREIAVGSTSLLVIIFGLLHMIQVQQAYFHWDEAGNKARRFFISIEALYSNDWSGKDMEFHFVNIPIRVGEAWGFPVGLDNAVWFAFKNEDAKVFKHNDLDSALSQAGYYQAKHVLLFNYDGSVKEIERFKGVPPNLIIPRQ